MNVCKRRVRWTCVCIALVSFSCSACAIGTSRGDDPNVPVNIMRSQGGLDVAAPAGLSLAGIGRSKVDVGLTIKGAWGTFINGKSYQQMPLDTFNNWQYATYYDQQRRLSIARRKLPDGPWEVIHFDDYLLKGSDNHNVTVLGICPSDGTIHLAFDHHGDALHYRVSRPGVAGYPEKVAWRAELFSEVRDWLQAGRKVESVTYPAFVRVAQGNLLFVRRHGTHLDGRIMLCEYVPAKGGWGESWQVTDSSGTYEFEGTKSDNRNAYLNGIHFDYASGRLHMSWHWREGDMDVAQHDLNYTYSSDGGRTWFNSAGGRIGGPGRFIGIDAPGLAVWEIPPTRGLDNQEGQCVDSLGRPHVMTWHLREGEPDLKPGRKNEARSAYHHYWRDAGGKWHQNELPYPVDKSERNRPKVLSTPNNDLVAMFNFQGKIVVCGATAGKAYRDWGTLLIEDGPWDGEPLPDLARWREQGVLSIYMQKDPSQAGQPTDLYVLDFKLR